MSGQTLPGRGKIIASAQDPTFAYILLVREEGAMIVWSPPTGGIKIVQAISERFDPDARIMTSIDSGGTAMVAAVNGKFVSIAVFSSDRKDFATRRDFDMSNVWGIRNTRTFWSHRTPQGTQMPELLAVYKETRHSTVGLRVIPSPNGVDPIPLKRWPEQLTEDHHMVIESNILPNYRMLLWTQKAPGQPIHAHELQVGHGGNYLEIQGIRRDVFVDEDVEEGGSLVDVHPYRRSCIVATKERTFCHYARGESWGKLEEGYYIQHLDGGLQGGFWSWRRLSSVPIFSEEIRCFEDWRGTWIEVHPNGETLEWNPWEG